MIFLENYNKRDIQKPNEPWNLMTATELLEKSGVRPFSEQERIGIYKNLLIELTEKSEQNPSGWYYRDSLLEPISTNDILLPNTLAACVEIGGTKLRVHGYTVNPDKPLSVEPITGALQPVIIHNKEFRNVEKFMQQIIELGQAQLDKLGGIHALGIVFSFDADVIRTPNGVDAHTSPDRLSKGFKIPGIENIYIGEKFISELQKHGYQVEEGYTVVVVNDVSDVMASVPEARLSLVLGTGFNIGIAIKNQEGIVTIHNTEAANLKSFPLSDPEKFVLHNSVNPDTHQAETITGGDSLGQTLEATLKMLYSTRQFKYQVNMPLTGADLSAILENNILAIKKAIPDFNMNDRESWDTLREIANRQLKRATNVVALSLAAMIQTHAEMFPEPKVVIPYTGSTFKLTPGFQRGVETIMHEVLPERDIRFIEVPGSTGASMLALREYAKKYSAQ